MSAVLVLVICNINCTRINIGYSVNSGTISGSNSMGGINCSRSNSRWNRLY